MLLLAQPVLADDLPPVKVYKTPTCGCCGKWVRHLEKAGFTVETTNMSNVDPVKQANGVPFALASCHTAIVDGYVVEGHVPVEDILRLLKERPAVKGIAVPGMPLGSPGMESSRPEPYKVLAFEDNGKITEFARHEP